MNMDMAYQAAGFNWFSIISMVLNLLLGSGLIFQFFTIKAQKRQAEANADQAAASAKQTVASAQTTEIQNVAEIAEKWRKYAEEAEMRYSSMNKLMQQQIKSLQTDMVKVNKQLNQILKIVKEITHENLEEKKKEVDELVRS